MDEQDAVGWVVESGVVFADAVIGERGNFVGEPSALEPVTVVRVEKPVHCVVAEVILRGLTSLHFAKDDAVLLAFAIHVVDLGVELGFGQGRTENVVEEDREESEEARRAGGDCTISSVVPVGPSIRTFRNAEIGELIQMPSIGIRFAAHENEVLKTVRKAFVVGALRGDNNVGLAQGSRNRADRNSHRALGVRIDGKTLFEQAQGNRPYRKQTGAWHFAKCENIGQCKQCQNKVGNARQTK